MLNKKIIIFNPSIEDGGVEKNLFIISNYLANKIKKINIITSDPRKNTFSNKIKIITHKYKLKKNSGRKIKYFLCLILLLKQIFLCKRKCLVFSFQANIYAIILCYFLGVKIISRSNSSPSGWSKNFMKKIIFSFFLKKAEKIVVNSKDFKKEINQKFKVKSKLIYNPFDFELIKKKSKIKLKKKVYKNNSLKILSIGRLTDQKDHLTLVKAIKLASNKINISAIIMGKGVLKENLIQFIKKNDLNKIVKIINYQKNPFSYIRNSDLFILTSKFEGHPNILVEAQFLKKFIISTNCPTGPKEILGNGKFGKLVGIEDYKSLSNAIVNYKLNSENKKKINQGFKEHKKYNLENNCKEYLNLIKKF